MDAKNLANRIFEIIPVLKQNEGLALLASKEKGFEGWFKVELCGLLSKYGNVLP